MYFSHNIKSRFRILLDHFVIDPLRIEEEIEVTERFLDDDAIISCLYTDKTTRRVQLAVWAVQALYYEYCSSVLIIVDDEKHVANLQKLVECLVPASISIQLHILSAKNISESTCLYDAVLLDNIPPTPTMCLLYPSLGRQLIAARFMRYAGGDFSDRRKNHQLMNGVMCSV